jgi:type IV pilus assembly protein PilM
MDNPFSQLFKSKDMNALGIDIGSSSIKVVELKKSGNKAVLQTYGELALGPYAEASIGQATKLSTAKIAEAMNDLLNEKEVAITTRNCGLAIPFSASLLTVIQMPNVKEEDLAAMVPIEARKYIPVPISEVTLDWSIIPKLEVKEENQEIYEKTEAKPATGKPATADILLVAIHNNIIGGYKEVIKAAGLEASFFEIELFSSMRSVLDETAHSVMIIDIGAALTKLYIVERGILRSSHIVNHGAQDITANIARINNMTFEEAEILKRSIGMNAESAVSNIAEAVNLATEYIFSEVNRTIYAYQNQFKISIEKVILIGGGAALKGFEKLAQDNLKTQVELGDPFSKVKTPAFLEDILRQTGPEFAVAVGTALRKLSEL